MVEKIQQAPASLTGLENAKNASKSGENNLKKGLLKGLDVDKFGLSADARDKVVWARAQFELNYQVLKSVNSQNGYETTQESFSFKAGYEFLQKASGGENMSAPAGVNADENTVEQDMLSSLQDYFSPEKTAGRILDVALSFFSMSEVAKSEGNNEVSRQKFSDFIGGAINEGFKQARGILGEMPENVAAGIDKTHKIIFSGLADFVKNGINPDKIRSGGVFDKIAAYREEGKAELTARIQSSRTVSYSSNGEAQTSSPKVSNLSTKG